MDEETRVCFFCEKAMAEVRSNYHKKLHKNTSDDHDPNYSAGKEIIKIVDVPRCPRCKSIHNIGFILSILIGFVSGILWIWYLVFADNTILNHFESNYDPELCRLYGDCPPTFQILLLGFLLGFGMGCFIVNRCIRIATRPVDDVNDYILVAAAKDAGFE
jgi:hypothetical protein